MLFILLSVLLLICIIIIVSNNNIFHPYKVYPYFALIYIIPYSILYLVKGNSILSSASLVKVKSEMYDLMCLFIVLTIISMFCFLLGVYGGSKRKKHLNLLKNQYRVNSVKYLKQYVFFFFTIGVLLFFLYYHSIGGISYYILNIANRSTLTSGAGHLYILLCFMLYFSSCLSILGVKHKVISKKMFLVFVLLTVLMLIISGSRSVVLRYFLLISTVAYYIYKPKIKEIFSKKNIVKGSVFFIILSLYIVITPIIRSSTLKGDINFSESFDESLNELEEIAKGNIYTEIQLNILALFSGEEHWLGKTYLDLLKIPIPRSIMPDKPSGDDGIYIYNSIINNKPTSIGSMSNLVIQSWPPSTFGISYANFGIIGVFVMFYFLGYFISVVYCKMLHSSFSFLFLFFYAYVFWRFQFSNLLIIEVLSVLIFLLLISFLFPRIRRIKLN